MLQGINRIGRSWAGRAIIAVMFGFLIVSFAIWGIGDIFRGNVRTQVATVGKTDVTADAFRSAYQSEYQALIRRARQAISPEQARALGLEQRVLGRLVSETAMDQRTRQLGLDVPNALVARTIAADPSFQGANGSFDRAQFVELLRSNGMSEAQFVRDQRSVLARYLLADALTSTVPVPLAMREAIHRYQTERRSIEYVVLNAAAAGEIAAPTDAQLQSFYDGRKAAYRAPDYRALTALTIDPASLAKPDAVSDEDARRQYERIKDTRFGTPERRIVQQIVFPAKGEADAAAAEIAGGTSFDDLAAKRGVDAASLTLGTFTRGDMLDPATADAAFGLAENAVSNVVEGRFGPVIVRVTKVEPGASKPFAEVAGEIKGDLARERAAGEIQSVHDAIEDQRSAAKSLADIAKERGLTLVQVPAVDRQGVDKSGQLVTNIGDSAAVLQAAFRSDVGADNEAVRSRNGGYTWFEVTGVEAARDRALPEVRERVAADWRSDELARLLSDKSRDMVGKLGSGETLAALAGPLGLQVQTADLERGRAIGAIQVSAVARAFATPVGQAADTAGNDESRIVFKVLSASTPPFVTTTQQAAGVEDQLRTALTEDMLGEYVGDVQKTIGVQVYAENVRRAIGGGDL